MDPNGATEDPRPDGGRFNNLRTVVETRVKHNDRSRVKETPFHLVSTRPRVSPLRLESPGTLLFGTIGQLNARLLQKDVPVHVATSVESTDAQASDTRNDCATSSENTQTSTRGEEPAESKIKLDLADKQPSAAPEATEICLKDGEERFPFISTKPHSAVKKKKRKMGLYNFAPKKKAKPLKHPQKKYDSHNIVQMSHVGGHEISVITKSGSASSMRSESFIEAQSGEPNHVEYTELNLACLDLKSQEELLLLPHSTELAQATESNLNEELPLCCCRMETPPYKGRLSEKVQTCMAMESADGMVKTQRERNPLETRGDISTLS